MLSAVISSGLATRRCDWRHNRYTRGPSTRSSRTRSRPLKYPAPTADRDQTVSRRFKPSSRTTLNGEQPYPWDRLQPQDVMSRHRVPNSAVDVNSWAESACYPQEYLLSVERWPFHTEPPDHYDLLSHLLDLSVSQSSPLLPLHYQYDVRPYLEDLRTPPLPLGGDRPSQTAYHARSRSR